MKGTQLPLENREEHLNEIDKAVGNALASAWLALFAVVAIYVPVFLGLTLIRERVATANIFLAHKIHAFNPLADAGRLARLIVNESEQAGVDPFFVASIIKHESSFRRSALSRKGACGLMQLMPSTAEYISKKDGIGWKGNDFLFEPEYNLKLGIAYLKYLHDLFDGDAHLALMAYNWGPANVKNTRRRLQDAVPSVEHYARRVLETQDSWQREFGVRKL